MVLVPRANALAADRHHRLGLSYEKIVDLLREALVLPVTRGGLAQTGAHLAALAQRSHDELLTLLHRSEVAHVDETGWRTGVLSTWPRVFTNARVTVCAIRRRRGHAVVLEILGRQFAGVLLADCFVADGAVALEAWLQQKCVAHLLRELRALPVLDERVDTVGTLCRDRTRRAKRLVERIIHTVRQRGEQAATARSCQSDGCQPTRRRRSWARQRAAASVLCRQ